MSELPISVVVMMGEGGCLDCIYPIDKRVSRTTDRYGERTDHGVHLSDMRRREVGGARRLVIGRPVS